MSDTSHTMDYREIIKAEFYRRRINNPFYSLRSFAKDLGLTPMHLSYLFKGKRGLAPGPEVSSL